MKVKVTVIVPESEAGDQAVWALFRNIRLDLKEKKVEIPAGCRLVFACEVLSDTPTADETRIIAKGFKLYDIKLLGQRVEIESSTNKMERSTFFLELEASIRMLCPGKRIRISVPATSDSLRGSVLGLQRDVRES